MRLSVDSDRATEVVTRLSKAFANDIGLLADKDDLVENQIPDGVTPLSRDHALFLFFTVPNDHGIRSRNLYSKAKNLFVTHRDLFEPASVLCDYKGPDDEQLALLLRTQLSVRYPAAAARAWYRNSLVLNERFEGDPRQLWLVSTSANTLWRELLSLSGVGPKIGGMMLRAIVGLGFAEVTELEEVLVPVDIHDSRISFWTRVVMLDNDTESSPSSDIYYQAVPTVQRVIRDACQQAGVPWSDVDRAMWLVGSTGCTAKRCGLCPLEDICTVGSAKTNGRHR